MGGSGLNLWLEVFLFVHFYKSLLGLASFPSLPPPFPSPPNFLFLKSELARQVCP